jgi:hypothetical protein
MSNPSPITIEESGDRTIITKRGVEVDLHADGSVDVFTDGSVRTHPAPANDTAAAAKVALVLGQQTADGVYAGLTADGKQQIFAMPTDLGVTMTFNDAAKAVKKLNSNKALGHDDWQITALENVRVLQKNQNEGALKGTFKTAASSGSDFPVWYWSSTELRGTSSYVRDVRFSDGDEGWDLKGGYRLSCRPVRLVAAPSLG